MIQFELNLVLNDEYTYNQKQEIRPATEKVLRVPGRDIEFAIIEIENKQKKNDTANMLTYTVKFKIHSLSFAETKKVLEILYSERFCPELKEALLKN